MRSPQQVVRVGLSEAIGRDWALFAVRAAVVRGDPVGAVDVLDGQPLALRKLDVAVEGPTPVRVELRPEERLPRRGVVRDDCLTTGVGKGCEKENPGQNKGGVHGARYTPPYVSCTIFLTRQPLALTTRALGLFLRR